MSSPTGSQKPVAVLDGEWASALAIVRSLGRQGVEVHVGATTSRPLASRSRFAGESFVYPDPLREPHGFRKVLVSQLASRSYGLVIPVTDRTIGPLLEDRGSVERWAPIAMASNDATLSFQSKSRTLELATRLNVPAPPGFVVHNESELDLLGTDLEFPLVLKPDRSKVWAANGMGHDLSVTYADAFDTFLTKMRALLRFGPVLVQKRVQGEGVGIGVYADRGETLFVFQYRRLHEVPLSGGASSYRVSEGVESQLANYATSLMKEVSWDGPAMVEFKRNPNSGQVWLIEVNGRFWGSLPLPVAAGADFPFILFNNQVRGRLEIPDEYKINVRCRSLERELLWFRDVLRHWTQDGRLSRPSWGHVLLDSIRVLDPRERWDSWSILDPGPGIFDIARISGKAIRQVGQKASAWLVRMRMRRARSVPRNLRRQLRDARRLLVVCRGNIIRSAYATGYMNQRQSYLNLAVDSAGISAIEGTGADPTALRVARSRGVDLSEHVAQYVVADLVGEADLIVAMEVKHILAVVERFPEARHKTFLLGCFGQAGRLEIPDPDYQNEGCFSSSFDLIEQSLDSMMEIRRGGQA